MSESVANALEVLAAHIRPLRSFEREIVASYLRGFGRDPDGIAFAGLLAGLTARQRQPAKIYQFSKQVAAK